MADGDDLVSSALERPSSGLRHVDIPEESCRVKAEFFDEPSKAIIREIKNFVNKTGQPHLWRGHTHTKPPIGAPVKYLDEFELPAEFSKRKLWMVCPVCHPETARFGKRAGMIAWFYEEGVIRLIGPDCFRTLNEKGHSEALDELRIRKRREEETRHLLRSREPHLAALTSLKAAHVVAGAIDTFGVTLRNTVYDRLAMPIWQHVRTGVLQTIEQTRETRINPNDPTDSRIVNVDLPVRYGALAGYEIFKPQLPKLSPRFVAPLRTLEEMAAIGDWESYVAGLSDHDRHKVADRVSQAMRAARTLRERALELRALLSVVNIATFRTWGALRNAPMPIYVRREGAVLWIGPAERVKMKVPIPEGMDTEIAQIPEVAEIGDEDPSEP